MKKFISLLTSGIAIVALSACGKGKNDILPTDGKYSETDYPGKGYSDKDYIALNHLLVNLKAGESKQLDVESYPSSYALNSLEFASKNESVATVNASGVVTGVSNGIADIEVKSKDGSFSNRIRVVVSTKSSASGSSAVIDAINAKYADASYEAPSKMIRYEYSVEEYACEGVRDHAMESYEIMGYDKNEGYFFVEGPTVYFKTPYGAPEVKDGKWIFYPINQGIKTRLIHITPTSKAYFDINTAAYAGDYDHIIRDIMNFFFVSGEKILTNMLEDFEGQKTFSYVSDSGTTVYAVNNDSLLIDLTEKGNNQVVDADDEINYYDIPADTVYSYDFREQILNYNARARAVDIDMTMYYERDGKDWTRRFLRSQLMDDDFEVVKIQNPKDNGFQAVDSIYDL